MTDWRDGEILEDTFTFDNIGLRRQFAFMLLESELDALIWTPWWWNRRSIVNRIKAQTTFSEPERDSDRDREADETQRGSVPEGDRARAEGIARKVES